VRFLSWLRSAFFIFVEILKQKVMSNTFICKFSFAPVGVNNAKTFLNVSVEVSADTQYVAERIAIIEACDLLKDLRAWRITYMKSEPKNTENYATK
jgi:hypothetical protein